jgi:hypothetical protein
MAKAATYDKVEASSLQKLAFSAFGVLCIRLDFAAILLLVLSLAYMLGSMEESICPPSRICDACVRRQMFNWTYGRDSILDSNPKRVSLYSMCYCTKS